MKEVIYVHAGSSHVATHFFNAQQSYFSYDNNDGGVPVDHDISFHEGRALDGSSNYYPRLLLFDSKANFGSLASINALGSEDEGSSGTDIWSSGTVEHRQDPIPPSVYHQQLDSGMDNISVDPTDDLTSSVRFWSDYSRVFFHPRGLHRVPDIAEWQHEIGWMQGADRFALYDSEHSVMEDSLRLFIEECDLVQGIQLTLDAPRFGSFIVPFLSQLRDEYPKLPLLSFCTLSSVDPTGIDLDNVPACMGTINDALTLYELSSLSNVTVPLQPSTMWHKGLWSDHIIADFTNPYHWSALLATHLESATLPLRLRSTMSSVTDLATICAHLNWHNDTPFSALSGAFTVPISPLQLDGCTYDFSHPPLIHTRHSPALPFAQRDVFRGLFSYELDIIQKQVDGGSQPSLPAPFFSRSYIDTPYLIPSSHPQFFARLDGTGRGILTSERVRVCSLQTYTTLRTTSRTGVLATAYARLVNSALTRRLRALTELGVEREMVEEARESWWKWDGAYGYDEETEDQNEEWGEDEKDV